MIPITLTFEESQRACNVGVLRNLEAKRSNLRDLATKPENGWDIHIEGAAGELAVAKFLEIGWDGDVNTFRTKADVGELEVRTRSNHNWDLIVRANDRDSSVFVLVTGRLPKFVIRGWIQGSDAKNAKYLANHGGYGEVFFVPQAALRSMSELLGSRSLGPGLAKSRAGAPK